MDSKLQDAAIEVVKATSEPIHDIGTAIYLSPDVFEWAAEWGWSNPSRFTSRDGAACSVTWGRRS